MSEDEGKKEDKEKKGGRRGRRGRAGQRKPRGGEERQLEEEKEGWVWGWGLESFSDMVSPTPTLQMRLCI